MKVFRASITSTCHDGGYGTDFEQFGCDESILRGRMHDFARTILPLKEWKETPVLVHPLRDINKHLRHEPVETRTILICEVEGYEYSMDLVEVKLVC